MVQDHGAAGCVDLAEWTELRAWAIAPGEPSSLSDQERDDQTPEGAYLQLVQSGGLAVDEGPAPSRA